MPEAFLSSEDYDEQAHQLYNRGDYDGALTVLKEGLERYPNSVELHVGLGYARIAREEFAWARRAFERGLVLDPANEDALVGLGETLLTFGERDLALALFRRVTAMGFDDDGELLLTMGRALYREALFEEARDIFAKAVAVRPDSAEAAASLGYTLHRLNDEIGASRQIRRALRISPDLHEARIFLGHILYDRGDWESALREFEHVPPSEHWDPLAVWRLIELKRRIWNIQAGDARLLVWETRLQQLESYDDPVDELLVEVIAQSAPTEPESPFDPRQLELGFESTGNGDATYRVRTEDGQILVGSWYQILWRMRERSGFGHEPISQYMRRMAERWHEIHGATIPFHDPESFFRSAIDAGFITLLRSDENA